MRIAVGSKNAAKLKAATEVAQALFGPQVQVEGQTVSSGVSDQPKSDQECIDGAMNRAKSALEELGGDYGIGMEGGIHQIGDRWFECGWMAVVHKDGRIGLGSSGRFELGPTVAKRLLGGEELAEVIDDLSGQRDVRSGTGAMGMVTDGHLPRDIAYTHGLYFAFGPFISPPQYWN